MTATTTAARLTYRIEDSRVVFFLRGRVVGYLHYTDLYPISLPHIVNLAWGGWEMSGVFRSDLELAFAVAHDELLERGLIDE